MRKIMMTLLMVAFCLSAFASPYPPQDTTGRKQDTTKKHWEKSKMPKKKSPEKQKPKKESTKKKMGDSTVKVPPVM